MDLPNIMVLKSSFNKKYLSYITEDGPLLLHGFVQFCGDEALSTCSMFAVEMAKTVEGDWFNIRCCYNNKYLVKSSETEGAWIVATAKQPQEDYTQSSCTLFHLSKRSPSEGVIMIETYTGPGNNHLGIWNKTGSVHDTCLFVDDQEVDDRHMFIIIDREELNLLPKHVAFKDDDGAYLCATYVDKNYFLVFGCNDIKDPSAWFETFPTPSGGIRIQSNLNGGFWRSLTTGIPWMVSDSCESEAIEFFPVKLEDNVVALSHSDGKMFCKPFTNHRGATMWLANDVISSDQYARLQVEEVVASREICDVKFRIEDSMIHDETTLKMAQGLVINSSTSPNTVNMKLAYTDTMSSTWNLGGSIKLGTKTSITAGWPFLAERKVEVSGEISFTASDGETTTSSTVVETTFIVTAPPNSSVNLTLNAKKGTCKVPFSYTQRDILINGKKIHQRKHDGFYAGINFYDFKYSSQPHSTTVTDGLEPVVEGRIFGNNHWTPPSGSLAYVYKTLLARAIYKEMDNMCPKVTCFAS